MSHLPRRSRIVLAEPLSSVAIQYPPCVFQTLQMCAHFERVAAHESSCAGTGTQAQPLSHHSVIEELSGILLEPCRNARCVSTTFGIVCFCPPVVVHARMRRLRWRSARSLSSHRRPRVTHSQILPTRSGSVYRVPWYHIQEQ